MNDTNQWAEVLAILDQLSLDRVKPERGRTPTA